MPIELEVVWKEGKPSAPDVEVETEKGPTAIIWTAGPDVASFEIVGLDTREFKPQTYDPGKTAWMTVDRNTTPQASRPKEFHYEIKAQRASGGSAAADPKITNVAG